MDFLNKQYIVLVYHTVAVSEMLKWGEDPLTFLSPVYVVSKIQMGDLHLQ